jgi:PPK2 family polyphosphate:nucleotide phosphotransferase
MGRLRVEQTDGTEGPMSVRDAMLAELLVAPGTPAGLAGRDPAWRGGERFADLKKKELKARARSVLEEEVRGLAEAQELLWASDTNALLAIFQAMDAAGKDSTIEHVMSGVNPQGVQVVSFKQPSAEELDHDYLWRVAKVLPERGRIGIFNRSHYEEVIAVRVHPEWLERQRLRPGSRGDAFWRERFEDINAFERHLDRNGTKIVKFFLHVSRQEQKERFLARLDERDKQWKFSAADVAERAHWDAYMAAYEEAISATSTPWAPWFVIPADRKWLMQALVAAIMVDTIESLDLRWPEVSGEELRANAEARRLLEAEDG